MKSYKKIMLRLLIAPVVLALSAQAAAQTPNLPRPTASNNPTTANSIGYVSTIQPPTPLTQEELDRRCPPNSSSQFQCLQREQSAYQQQLQAYEAAKQQEAAWLQQQQSALQSAQQADQATKNGSKSYLNLQMITQVLSMAAAAKAASCGAVPGCPPPWIGVSIAMAAASSLSAGQKANMDQRQFQACTVASQLSSSANNCGAPPPTFTASNYPARLTNESGGDLIDASGNCTGTPQFCQQLIESLPPGVTLRDYQKGVSQFASGKAPFKVNPDGSITTKDGKNFPPGSLDTLEELTAAGVPTDLAKSTLAGLSKFKSALDANEIKEALAASNKSDSGVGGEFGGSTGGGSRIVIGANGGNGDANDAGLSSDNQKRDVASTEGLVKDFNGELIGVKGDDIFKMMRRRYLLKDKQDSFINTAAPQGN